MKPTMSSYLYKWEDGSWGSERTLQTKAHWILEQFEFNEMGREDNGGWRERGSKEFPVGAQSQYCSLCAEQSKPSGRLYHW